MQVFIMVFGAWIASMAVLVLGFMSLPDIVEWLDGAETVDDE